MNEIYLIRGKAINRYPNRTYRTDYENGDWVYGLITDTENYQGFAEMTNTDGISGIDVDKNTIGRCTGLRDKNGKLIFKDDIVKIVDFQVGVVTYECGAFGASIIPRIDWDYLDSEIAEITGCDNMPYFCRNDNFISLWELMWNYNQEENYCEVVEVIGNIHDNPELLEAEK